MAKQSALIKKQEQLRSLWYEQAEAATNQYMLDCALIALHREFGFGAERLKRFMRELGAIHDRYYAVFKVSDPECDKLRAEMDALLQECCAPEDAFIPFSGRYDNIKEVRYKKNL